MTLAVIVTYSLRAPRFADFWWCAAPNRPNLVDQNIFGILSIHNFRRLSESVSQNFRYRSRKTNRS